ncbi:hypothetical protein D3C75_840910 [compost metagenome]
MAIGKAGQGVIARLNLKLVIQLAQVLGQQVSAVVRINEGNHQHNAEQHQRGGRDPNRQPRLADAPGHRVLTRMEVCRRHSGIVHSADRGPHHQRGNDTVHDRTFMIVPQMKSQPQTNTRGEDRNYNRKQNNGRVPVDIAVAHQGGHAEVMHRHYPRAEDCGRQQQARNRQRTA